jgi:hypothetical protein
VIVSMVTRGVDGLSGVDVATDAAGAGRASDGPVASRADSSAEPPCDDP